MEILKNNTTPALLITFLVIIAFSGCNLTGPPPVDNPGGTRGNGLGIELIPPQRTIQGSPATYTFHIRNNTDRPAVLLEIVRAPSQFQTTNGRSIEGKNLQEGARHSWVHNPPGLLSYRKTKDQIRFTPVKGLSFRRATFRLYSGLLFPGETESVKIQAIHQNTGNVEQTFLLRFHHPKKEELLNNLYVPPKNKKIQNAKSLTFRSVSHHARKSVAESKYIVFRKPFQTTEEKTISKSVRIHPRPFSLSDALQKLKDKLQERFKPQDVRYSPWLKGWVILNGNPEGNHQLWRVSKWKMELLPELPFTHFKTLNSESGPLKFYVEKDFEGTGVLQKLYNKTTDKQNSQTIRSGKFFKLDRKQALTFLALLVDRGIPLDWVRQPLTDRLIVNIISSP